MHLDLSNARIKPMNRRLHPVTLSQAAQDSPVLAMLTELTRDSADRLQAIQSMIPASLQSAITAGPIEGPIWCLIVNSSAAAAKIRQFLPALEAHLHTKGWKNTSIRLKVQTARRA
jgi:hypothetical protein